MKANEVHASVTEPTSAGYIVLQLLRDGPCPVSYVTNVSGVAADAIEGLEKSSLVIRWRDGEKDMLRLSAAGIAVAGAVAEAYAAIHVVK